MGVAQEVATEVVGGAVRLGKVYPVVVQVVILFGSETWVLLVPMYQRLEGVYVDFLKQVTNSKAK